MSLAGITAVKNSTRVPGSLSSGILPWRVNQMSSKHACVTVPRGGDLELLQSGFCWWPCLFCCGLSLSWAGPASPLPRWSWALWLDRYGQLILPDKVSSNEWAYSLCLPPRARTSFDNSPKSGKRIEGETENLAFRPTYPFVVLCVCPVSSCLPGLFIWKAEALGCTYLEAGA